MADISTGLSLGASAAYDAIGNLDQRQQGSQSKVVGAAKDFEALLLTQVLKSARGEGGWLGTDQDDAGDAAVGFGEEQLARTIAMSGGMGLSKLIESGLRTSQEAAESASTQP